MKEPIHKAMSPDGKLTFAVVFDEEFCVGFPDHAWHTHGDILVPEYGPDGKTATYAFFDSVIQDRLHPSCGCVSAAKVDDLVVEKWDCASLSVMAWQHQSGLR